MITLKRIVVMLNKLDIIVYRRFTLHKYMNIFIHIKCIIYILGFDSIPI